MDTKGSWRLGARLLMVACAILVAQVSFGATQHHRVIWDANPAHEAVIGFSPDGSSNDPRVIYGFDTNEGGWNTAQVDESYTFDGSLQSHFVRLSGLPADSEVYYRVCDQDGCGDRFWFRTAPEDDSPYVAVAGGDTRSGWTNRRQGNDLLAKIRPLFVMHGGDFTNDNSASEMRSFLTDWERTYSDDQINGLSYNRIYPLIPAHGNHEDGNYSTLCEVFGVDFNQDGACTPRDTYGAFNVSPLLRVYTLNSQFKNGGWSSFANSMNNWLEDDLVDNGGGATWRMAQYHKPLFPHTSGKAENDDLFDWWAGAFYDHRMNLVVESDSHVAKLTESLVPSGDGFMSSTTGGTVYTGEGSWGAPARSANDPKSWTLDLASIQQFKVIQVRDQNLSVRTAQFNDSAGRLSREQRQADSLALPDGINWWSANEVGEVVNLVQNDSRLSVIDTGDGSGEGDVVTLAASDDTFISSEQPDANLDDNGDGLLADGDDGTYGEMRSLIKFDLNGLPECADASSLELEVNVTNASAGSYEVYAAASDWQEGSATWNGVGGDSLTGALLGSFTPTQEGRMRVDLSEDVLGNWQDDGNFGLVISSAGTNDGVDMTSRETGSGPALIAALSDGSDCGDTGGDGSSGSGGDTATSVNSLMAGDRLNEDESLSSSNGAYSLNMQGDGNLVLRDSSGDALWASGTAGDGATRLQMQGDGNLVLYTDDGSPVWASDTNGTDATRMVLNNDGSLAVYAGETPVWSVNGDGNTGDGGDDSGGDSGGPISHLGSTADYDGGGNVDISVPSNAEDGDLLMLFLSRTDDVLPIRLDGWTAAASCFKTTNGQNECHQIPDCTDPDGNYCRDFEGGNGRDLATVVFYRTLDGNDNRNLSFDLRGGAPGWAILSSLRGADNTNPIVDVATESDDGDDDSLYPSVYGNAGDMLLLSQAFDDTTDRDDFRAPEGMDMFRWIAGPDEAGYVYGENLTSSGQTGSRETQGPGGPGAKDALISLTVRQGDTSGDDTDSGDSGDGDSDGGDTGDGDTDGGDSDGGDTDGGDSGSGDTDDGDTGSGDTDGGDTDDGDTGSGDTDTGDTGGAEQNLVLPGNGATLESFTSEYSSNFAASSLTDGVIDNAGWASRANPDTQEFVYSFSNGQSATLNEAVIHGGTAEGLYFSESVEVWAAPSGGDYRKLGEGSLGAQSGESVTLDLGGVSANRVKLVVTNGHRDDYWELSEFVVNGTLDSTEEGSGHETNRIAVDSGLVPGQWLESNNGDYRLYLQDDGNLVLRDTGTNEALWASGTDGDGGSILTLESDGNLVLYSDDATPVWETDTVGSGDAELVLENDGMLALYQDGTAVWSVNGDVDNSVPEQNLILPENGATLESFTSEYGNGWLAADLTDGITDDDGWASTANPGTQEFVYSFRDGESATLNEAVIHGGTAEGSYFSRDVEVWAAPSGGEYARVGSGTLGEQSGESVRLDLGGVSADRVKLMVTSGYRSDYWELSEFVVNGTLGTGGDSGGDSDGDSGDGSGDDSGGDSGDGSGGDSGDDSGSDSGDDSGGDSGGDTDDDSSGDSGGDASDDFASDVTSGLGRFSTPDAALYSLNDSRERVFPEHINTGFNGNGHSVTQDGRVFLVTRSGRWAAVPFRPERITVNGDGTPDFRDGAFGEEVLLESEDESEDRQIHQNWLAVVPDHSVDREHPYPSDRDGNFRENGNYATYDTIVYQTSTRNGDNDQVGYRRATFVMSDPETRNAELVSADFTSSFQKLQRRNGDDVRCIEISVTMDGRLLVCQGHPANDGRIDNLVYAWNDERNSTTGWSEPRSLADMYYVDRNSDVDGMPFQVRYPIAEEPIRDASGDAYEQGELIKGAYPWISRDGSELFYQSSREGVSARRTATTVVGRWTGGMLRHIDGPINRDRHETSKLFLSSPGAVTTMWQPFKDVEDLRIPYSVRGPSYPIFGSNTRDYSEVEFDDYLDGNYVLAYGMNEQMGRGGEYLVNRTPDTSGNFNNATLEGGAAFPLEFNGDDELQGRYGQGIYFPSDSYLQVQRNQGWESLRDGFTVDMFVRRMDTGGGDVPLFQMENGIELYLANGSDLTGVIEDVDGNRERIDGPGIPGGWSHVALRFDPEAQTMALFVDGRQEAERNVSGFGSLRVGGGVRIGPDNANALLMLDEVHVSNVAREAYEVGHNAYADTHEEPSELLSNSIPDHLSSMEDQATAVEGFSFEAAELGESLFSDQILSRERTTSCATCHEPGKAFTDGQPIAQGNEPTDDGRRNTPMLQNRLFSTFQGWAGGNEDLEVQAVDPIQAEHEMNLPIEQAIERLRSEGDYASQFQSAFDEEPTAENLAQALASFQAIQFSAPTRVDEYLEGDESALTDAEERGLQLFRGKARCSGCHAGRNFTDESFRATGLADNGDPGRAAVTDRKRDFKLFKVPSLRAVAQTGPYMHDGSLPSLRAVVEEYNEGAPGVEHADTDMRPLNLSDSEIDDLVTFMQALSGSGETQEGVDNGGSTDSGDGDNDDDAPTSENSLFEGDRLNVGEQIQSSNGDYRLTLQSDGNLVLYTDSGDALWASDTVDSGAADLNMQGDGNLVLRTESGDAVWSSSTNGTDATRLTLTDDGALAIYRDSTVVQYLR